MECAQDIGVFRQRNSEVRVGLGKDGCARLEQTCWRQARGEEGDCSDPTGAEGLLGPETVTPE